MGFFSNSTEKSAAEANPINPDITRQYGSGAEQDRYGSHFSPGSDRIEKGWDKMKQAASYKGEGAEQDRYNAHFSPAAHDTDMFRVQQAAQSIKNQVQTGASTSMYGLGYDGQQRAKLLAGGGVGAEQDRYGGHFGLTREGVENAADKLKEGARDMFPRK